MDDSARYIFESLLLPAGAWTPPSLDSIASLIRTGNALNYARGINGFDVAFAKSARPADSIVAGQIVNRILEYEIDRRPLWPMITPSWKTASVQDVADTAAPPGDATISPRVFVSAPAIPESARAPWKGRVTWIGPGPVTADQDDTVMTIAIAPIKVAGPFIVVTWSRTPDDGDEREMPTILLRKGDGWVVVPRNFFAWND